MDEVIGCKGGTGQDKTWALFSGAGSQRRRLKFHVDVSRPEQVMKHETPEISRGPQSAGTGLSNSSYGNDSDLHENQMFIEMRRLFEWSVQN